jgi:Peptidase inhibitor family I36
MKTQRFIGLLLAVATMFVAAPLTGTAAAAKSDCPAGYMCLWEHANYSGRMIAMRRGADDFRIRFRTNFNDVASSYWNRANTWFCLYEHIGFRGAVLAVYIGEDASYIGNTWNDRVSSAYIC